MSCCPDEEAYSNAFQFLYMGVFILLPDCVSLQTPDSVRQGAGDAASVGATDCLHPTGDPLARGMVSVK